ncbi:MAG: hypothetical protein PUC94_07935 [Bacteroidales bacterium]|nr:hypothetical protein [Bacteroidales bacterium]
MKAQDIYLSPRQIISYLMEFEKKLPEPHKGYYVPQIKQTPISTDELNQEAKRMMDFIGLNSYKPQCSFCQLEEGIGGNTKCCNANVEVEINVSSKYRNNIEQTVAVLAHEICHKYLYVHGLYNPIEVINEIFTDLCTMYVGFGEIIIAGYVTEKIFEDRSENFIHRQINTEYLGYLKFPIYRSTLNIVRLVLWNENASDVLGKESDPLLLDAFKCWISERDKKTLSRKILIDRGKETAEFTKNLLLLDNLIRLAKGREFEDLQLAESQFYNEDWFDTTGHIAPRSKVAVFNSIYQSIIMESKSNGNIVSKNINRYFRHLIMLVYDALAINSKELLNTEYFECPFCGERHKSTKFINKTALIRCPKCKKRFYLDCVQFDLMNTRNDFDHFKDELIKPVRRGYLDSLENEKRKSYQKGYEVGRISVEKEFRDRIAKLPSWLRKLIGDKLN